MNPTIEAAKEITREQTRQLTLALEFIPQERRGWVPSGCAKTPLGIYLECAGTYLWAARFLLGESADWAQVLPKAKDCPGLAEAKKLMEKYQNEFFSALEGLDESRLGETVSLPWGEKMTLGQYLLLPSYHTCYHCGQLNYIQALLGDGELHF